MVDLKLDVMFFDGYGEIHVEDACYMQDSVIENYSDGMTASTRLAIVRAAAEIGRMTEVVETPEQEQVEALEGTHESPQQKTRIFYSLRDLTDYIDAFKIDSGSWASGILQNTGEKVYQLTYISYQGE